MRIDPSQTPTGHESLSNPALRNWSSLNRFTSVLSYEVGINPLEAARADKASPASGFGLEEEK